MVWDERKSLIAFSLKHHRRRRRVLEGAMRDPALRHLRWVRLRRPRETDAWLAGALRGATDSRLGDTPDNRLRATTDDRQRQQTTDRRRQTADDKQQTTDSRRQTTDSR
ncbi:MAG TPA: hypothetical protein VNM91_11370, partial [Dehalococcoidia bacterium]|nr:hypothetical protein [Dehalococcoidia bacterium]